MKCTLGRGHSHMDILVSCPGMSSGVKHAKSVQESYKFGISKSQGFMVEKNLTNSCFHTWQTLNFAYVAYIELEVKSFSTFKIPKCWLERCLPPGSRPAPVINITSHVPDPGRPGDDVCGFPSCGAALLLRTKVPGPACWEAACFCAPALAQAPPWLAPPRDLSFSSDDWNKKGQWSSSQLFSKTKLKNPVLQKKFLVCVVFF